MDIPLRAVTLALLAVVVTTSVPARAQQFGFNGGGSGPLSPSVVATWQHHFEAAPGQQDSIPFSGPMVLDLLVLWRGRPGWFDGSVGTGAGGTDGVHFVGFRGRSLQVRFDRQADTVQIEGQTFPLQGANVVLLDGVDTANAAPVVGMMRVDPAMSTGPLAGGGPTLDPLSMIIHRSPELFDYLRCDPFFTDPNDPEASIKLRNCEQLR
jgi:hypothetical protein